MRWIANIRNLQTKHPYTKIKVESEKQSSEPVVSSGVISEELRDQITKQLKISREKTSDEKYVAETYINQGLTRIFLMN